MKRLLVEFLGTFFLVAAVALTANPLAIASMLMAWVYIGGYLSGAHYNPAVSLAAVQSKKLASSLLARYWLAQIAGGFAAYVLAAFLMGQVVVPAPAAGVSWLHAFVVEVLLAFVFCLVVLVVSTARDFKNSYIFGFAIGFTVPALAILGTPISGGLFNPAIALGANLYGLLRGVHILWAHLFLYVGGALLGGLLAAHAFKYFVLDEEK